MLRYPYQTPPTWYVFDILGSFRDVSARTVATQGTVRLNPAHVHGNAISEDVVIPPGTGPLSTNIASPACLVHVTELPVARRTGEGFLALGLVAVIVAAAIRQRRSGRRDPTARAGL